MNKLLLILLTFVLTACAALNREPANTHEEFRLQASEDPAHKHVIQVSLPYAAVALNLNDRIQKCYNFRRSGSINAETRSHISQTPEGLSLAAKIRYLSYAVGKPPKDGTYYQFLLDISPNATGTQLVLYGNKIYLPEMTEWANGRRLNACAD